MSGKTLLYYITFFIVFLIFTSVVLSSILAYFNRKKIENEISNIKQQKEILLNQYNNARKEISKIVKERKEKNNLKEIIQKLNPNVNQEFLDLCTDMIYENKKFIEESLNPCSKIKLTYKASPFSLEPGSSMILAVIAIESNFNTDLRSNKGAVGVFQIISGTANELGLKNPWKPSENITGGIKYLSYLLKRFNKYKDQIHFTFASYNAGPTRVINEWIPTWGDSWSLIFEGLSSEKSYRETRDYSVLAHQLMTLFASGKWANKNEYFWIDYKNNILDESKDNLYSLIF
ncbi:MAG: transglycosylase SLT domain-containing protein [Candidatus Helarchaeota archaeon]|nr:transglycosylase SLT domain-containing protein [Candidatus Helarchaeota archaeon]